MQFRPSRARCARHLRSRPTLSVLTASLVALAGVACVAAGAPAPSEVSPSPSPSPPPTARAPSPSVAPSDRPSPSRAAPVRALWVTRWDFRTRDDLVTIVHRSRDLGFNRIYLQVRGRADALYRSSLEPWAEEIGGRDPGYDPLEVATREARDAGIELHAWVNVLSGWKGKSPPSDRTHVVHRHPDWFLLDRFQKRHIYDDHYTILNPCLEDVREHIAKVIEDIARRYPIDGVQLDYIRFIAESARDRQAVPYDNLTLRQFRLENDGDFPIRRPQEWDAFRRRAIDTLVERIARGVRTIRPTAVISAAVIRDFDRARSHYFQDATKWVSARWVDEIVTMNYERELPRFEHHLATAIERAGANRVIAGIGAYLIGTPADVAAQIESSLRHGARGWAIFAYTDLFPSRSHESKSGADAERRRAEMRRVVERLTRNVSLATPQARAPSRPAPRRAPAGGE